MQTDATLLANNSQHCWMLHVKSVCTPCCMKGGGEKTATEPQCVAHPPPPQDATRACGQVGREVAALA